MKIILILFIALLTGCDAINDAGMEWIDPMGEHPKTKLTPTPHP